MRVRKRIGLPILFSSSPPFIDLALEEEEEGKGYLLHAKERRKEKKTFWGRFICYEESKFSDLVG